jgi:hypothetical protein
MAVVTTTLRDVTHRAPYAAGDDAPCYQDAVASAIRRDPTRCRPMSGRDTSRLVPNAMIGPVFRTRRDSNLTHDIAFLHRQQMNMN